MVANVPELETWDRLGGMARQDLSQGRDVERPATPAADTGLGKTRVIVRQHRIDHDVTVVNAAATPLPGAIALIDLFACGHQRRAIFQGPAIVLHMRNLDTLCFQLDGQIDHFANARDIGAVHDRIDRERQAEPYRFGCQRKLALERTAIAGNVIRRYGVGVLDRDLEVVEAWSPKGRAWCAW